MKKYLFFLLFFSACSPSSVEDFRLEGELQAKALSTELSRIHSCAELQEAIPVLRKNFLKFSNLVIRAREFRAAHPDIELTISASYASDELFAELSRIYELPNGKELIERAEIPAIDRILKKKSE